MTASILLTWFIAQALPIAESTGQQTAAPSEPLVPALKAPTLSPIAGWQNGFFLQAEDQSFFLRITGQIQADYRDFLGTDDVRDVDTFLVRRARLGIEATLFRYYEFRLLPDFVASRALQDGYINIHYWDAFQVEAGKFKQPFSYEQLVQDRFVPTMERSLIDQLGPSRDFGLMVHGQKLLGGRLDYAVAVSNGDAQSDADLNDHKDVAGRLVLYPFSNLDWVLLLRYAQVGISGTYGRENELVSPNVLRTPATVPWFQFNPTVRAEGRRSRWSPEAAWFVGPFGCAAQYFREEQELRPSTAGAGARLLVDVPYEGFYVMASCLLTGETRTGYSQPIEPLAPFDPTTPGWAGGAWELMGRFSRLRVGDVVFAPGAANLANASLYSPEASEMTLGVNWYVNRWVRFQCNWEHAMFDRPVQLGNGGQRFHRTLDTLLARMQIIF